MYRFARIIDSLKQQRATLSGGKVVVEATLTTQGVLLQVADEMLRRGASIRKLFPEVALEQDAIIEARKARRLAASAAKDGSKKHQRLLSASNEHLFALRRNLRRTMINLLRDDLPRVTNLLARPDQLWVMDPIKLQSKRVVYRCRRNDRAALIARELVARELREVSTHHAPNRHSMAFSLLAALEDRTPKTVVRADIEAYYESVSHDRLRRKIEKDFRISSQCYRNILGLLNEFETASGTCGRGVPAGLAVSGILAEIALVDVDISIAGQTDVSLYLRFVDDILVVYPHWSGCPDPQGRKLEVETVVAREELALNVAKTGAWLLNSGSQKVAIEYLGYEFISDGTTWRVELSQKRTTKVISRLESSFEAYRKGGMNPRATRALSQRIAMLTSNYRLASPRGNVLAGVHFGSPLVPPSGDSIRTLDRALADLIDKNVSDTALRVEIAELTFESGIRERRFMRASWRRLGHLARIWKGL